MKKITVLAVLICLLFTLVPHAQAAGSASLSGPSTVRAGDTITLSFRAGGGILGGNGTLSYDSSLLTLNSCSQSLGGTWVVELIGSNFVFYDNTMSNPLQSSTTIFTLSFTVNANVAPGTPISVTASGVTLSDGKQDYGAGSPSWSAVIAPPLSGNCDLGSLSVSAGMTPAFRPDVTNYSASVPFTTTSVVVDAKALDSTAKVAVSNPQLVAGGTTEIRITVTAENGAVKVYTVRVARAQDPNYVPSNNAELEGITVDGELLSMYFSAEKRAYYVWLPYDTEAVKITGKAVDSKASVSVEEIAALPAGGVTAAAVTVTAEDGTQQPYTVYLFRLPSLENTEAFFQAVERYREDDTQPTEPEQTQPAETVAPTMPEETEPLAAPAPDARDDSQLSLILWVSISILGGVLLGFTVTFLATRPRKKY